MGFKNAGLPLTNSVAIRRGGCRSSKEDRPYDELRRQTRMVIGLLQSTELTRSDIGLIVGLRPRDLSRFISKLWQDKFTAKLLSGGMPGAYGESLPAGVVVKCQHCGVSITAVPCVTCWPCRRVEPGIADWRDVEFPEGPGVHIKPGSWEKIELMASRVAAELSPFSKGDTWSEPLAAAADDAIPQWLEIEEDDASAPTPEDLYQEFMERIRQSC